MDFGDRAITFRARVAADDVAGGDIYVYVDGCDLLSNLPGERIGECPVSPTGGWQTWTDVECEIEPTDGVRDVFLRFVGASTDELFNLDCFEFE